MECWAGTICSGRSARPSRGIAVQMAGEIALAARQREVLASRTVSDPVVGSGVDLLDARPHDVEGMPDDWWLYRAAI